MSLDVSGIWRVFVCVCALYFDILWMLETPQWSLVFKLFLCLVFNYCCYCSLGFAHIRNTKRCIYNKNKYNAHIHSILSYRQLGRDFQFFLHFLVVLNLVRWLEWISLLYSWHVGDLLGFFCMCSVRTAEGFFFFDLLHRQQSIHSDPAGDLWEILHWQLVDEET